MSEEKIKELREKFFVECTNRDWLKLHGKQGLPKIDTAPHDTFQWIVDNVIKAKEEHECMFYVNADWTGYSPCVCGKRHPDTGEVNLTK